MTAANFPGREHHLRFDGGQPPFHALADIFPLLEGAALDAEEIVIYDDLGAGPGSRIAFAESGEAAAPFHPEKKPIDAYCACLLDSLTIAK